MKNLLIKLGLWEEITRGEITSSRLVDEGWYQTAMKHYCGTCERWFKEARGAGAHQRVAHEGLFKKDRSKDA